MRIITISIFLFCSFCCENLISQDQQSPNIILIMTDDQGFETIGAYGGESYQTPVLDNMAKTGIRFDQVYAIPVCTPTRLAIMSGKYNSRNYTEFGKMEPDVYTFGNLFQDAGYATFIGREMTALRN